MMLAMDVPTTAPSFGMMVSGIGQKGKVGEGEER